MRGIKRVKKCPPVDAVWGTLGFECPPLGAFPVASNAKWDHAVRVRPKVTPYGADYGEIRRGEVPSWTIGKEYFIPQPVRFTPNPTGPDAAQSRYVLGTRAVYVDNEEAYVNYLYVGTPSLGRNGLQKWFQLNTVTEETGLWRINQYWSDINPTGFNGNLGLWEGEGSFEPLWVFDDGGTDFPPWFDPGAPFSNRPNNLWDAPPPSGIGFQTADMLGITRCRLQTVGDDGYNFVSSRPSGWYAGKRYCVFSGYLNSDGLLPEMRYGIVRYDNQTDTWFARSVNLHNTSQRYKIVRPTMRAYLRSNAPQPDEPWVISIDHQTQTLGTGRWRHNSASLQGHVENVIPIPAGCNDLLNIRCYNRMFGRDLIVVRQQQTIYPDMTGIRSGTHWVWTGSRWITPMVAPSYVACDEDGTIYYGNKRYIVCSAPDGQVIWEYRGQGFFGPYDKAEDIPESLPPEDPEAQPPESTDYEVPINVQAEEHDFQILIGKSWIHLRGWIGFPSQATISLHHGDWPEWVRPTEANGSFKTRGSAYNFIPCWSFSRDGTVRVPHVQASSPFDSNDNLRRIFRRTYVGKDQTERARIFGNTWWWPRWMASNTENDYWPGMMQFFPRRMDYGNDEFAQIYAYHFHATLHNWDFDIADACPCCCREDARAY